VGVGGGLCCGYDTRAAIAFFDHVGLLTSPSHVVGEDSIFTQIFDGFTHSLIPKGIHCAWSNDR
jgi:hypothetical protein